MTSEEMKRRVYNCAKMNQHQINAHRMCSEENKEVYQAQVKRVIEPFSRMSISDLIAVQYVPVHVPFAPYFQNT